MKLFNTALLTTMALLPIGSALGQSTVNDTYVGELEINASNSLPLQLNLTETEDGYAATLDSPAQGARGIPIDSVQVSAEQLSFSSKMIQASFNGKHDDDGCYEGTFTQGMSYPLTLCPDDGEQAPVSLEEQLSQLPAEVAIVTFDEGQWQVDHKQYNVEAEQQFEIGSVTKTMVALLLAQAIESETLSVNTTIGDIWPEANDEVAQLTLVSLATHHSGLPRLPSNLSPASMDDPYANYGLKQLTQALASTEVAKEKAYQYSNFGYGLLAESLAKHYQMPLNTLFQEQLFEPLGMKDSQLALVGTQADNLLTGTRIDGQPTANWQFQQLAGAGAVVATTDDMVRYLKAMMRPDARLQPIVERVTSPQEILSDNVNQAYGWILESHGDDTIIWHNGQTAGFTSFIGYTADGKRGVVILNAKSRTVTDIGKRLLLEQ